MIITLTGANFNASNIGALTTYSIKRNFSSSRVNVTSGSLPDMVDRTTNEGITATLTVVDDYEIAGGASGVSVTMNGEPVSVTVDGNTITINIDKVTGNVIINISTKKVGVIEEEGGGESGGTTDEITTWTSVTGTRVATSMITADGKASSTSGVVYDFTGYDWSNYAIRVTCRYGTNTAMYAGGFWDASNNFLGGFWLSQGTAQVFTQVELTDSDLPTGVSWSDIATISLCASELSGSPLTVPVLEIISKDVNNTPETSDEIIIEGTNVAKKMPTAEGYADSTNGQVMEYSGYNWADYDIYVSCRYGTTNTMYAACVWGTDGTYLGGIWQSTGTATIFTEQLLQESDLPSGVTWADVEKIGLAWSTGKNTPAMKLVPKAQ